MKPFYLISFFFLFSFSANAQIKYVTQYGGGTNDGSSWENSWSGKIFADTIYYVTSGTQVWVAKGTYKSTKDYTGKIPTTSDTGNPDANAQIIHKKTTFRIPSGVKVYGGFAGTETLLSDRVDSLIHGVNNTILDGSDFSGHISPAGETTYLVSFMNVNDSTGIDGFYSFNADYANFYIFSDGVKSSSPVIKNCLFTGYPVQSAIYIDTKGTQLSTPVIENSYFLSLNAYYGPGAFLITNNNKTSIVNCVFIYCKNSGGFEGSTILFSSSHGGSISNCTFYKNSIGVPPQIGLGGGAICTNDVVDSIYLNNCIFRENYNNPSIDNTSVSSGLNYYSASNCDLQAQDPTLSVEPLKINCIDADPLFKYLVNFAGVDNVWGTSDDGISLAINSPCKDNGYNNLIPSFINKDILNKPRVSSCTTDMGAYEFQIPDNGIIILPESNIQTCTQYPVGDTGTVYTDPLTCGTTVQVQPEGANPVTGTVKVCVQKDAVVQIINGVPYVQRHYDIEPLQAASTATSRITLYYTQQEFDNYNAVAGSLPKLPASPIDGAGIANIQIEQDHGFSLTGVPGTYSGITVYINPDDADIIWNSTSSIWEVSFNVTGFSGFFMRTGFSILPISLSNFTAKENDGIVDLYWQTGSEINSKYFDVKRSNDGRNFISLGKVTASGNANGYSYIFNDNDPNIGLNYYQLVMVDKNNTNKNSSIIAVNLKGQDGIKMEVSPNPAVANTAINISGKINERISIVIYDINGRKISSLFTDNVAGNSYTSRIDLSQLQKGVYVIEVQVGTKKLRSKLIKQ